MATVLTASQGHLSAPRTTRQQLGSLDEKTKNWNRLAGIKTSKNSEYIKSNILRKIPFQFHEIQTKKKGQEFQIHGWYIWHRFEIHVVLLAGIILVLNRLRGYVPICRVDDHIFYVSPVTSKSGYLTRRYPYFTKHQQQFAPSRKKRKESCFLSLPDVFYLPNRRNNELYATNFRALIRLFISGST